ncbi:MAG: c-type cytochrome [Saprospiraceae bacterium]|nr:c-type cytochrome [Saprospiraceae bacterium]
MTLSNIMLAVIVAILLLMAVAIGQIIVKLLDGVIRLREIKIYEESGVEEFIRAKIDGAESNLWDRIKGLLSDAVPVEKEKDILFDHTYDGIQELDNNLPPWWLYGFYGTIVIAVLYMGYYHVLGYGPSSLEEYEAEVALAEEQVQEFLSKQANLVDENSVALLTDQAALESGQLLFNVNCVACHLESGGSMPGGVGPNLTDEYWLHGGSLSDVFKTIKYGVPEKGMISWQGQLRPRQMQEVASYIMSLQGTNPANAKEPQGELYVPEATEAAADSSQVNG